MTNYSSIGNHFYSIFCALLILLPMGLLNKYIFDDSNSIFFASGLLFVSILVSRGKVNLKFFNSIIISFLSLMLYAFIRFNWEINSDNVSYAFILFNWENNSDNIAQAITLAEIEVINLMYFFCCFYCAAIIFAKYGYLSNIITYLILFYIVAFILKNSADIKSLQQGYNSSPGFLVMSMLPLLFIKSRLNIPQWIIYAITFSIIFWLALIGTRTSVMSLMLFLLTFWIWPFISRTKARYIITFLCLLFGILCFNFIYLKFVNYSNDYETTFAFYEIFNKTFGTRVELWKHLLIYIRDNPWFGHGTEQITHFISPVENIDFKFNRNNLSAHSIYFEILYRLGIVGLFLFLLIIFRVWMCLWLGREQQETRVAGSFIVALLCFMTFSKFLIFSPLGLYSCFCWVVLGIGAGASLRHTRNFKKPDLYKY